MLLAVQLLQYQGWGSWQFDCQRQIGCWGKFEGENTRGQTRKILGRYLRFWIETWLRESTGTQLCLLSPQWPARPSLLRCLSWWSGKNGVWFGGQDTLEHTRHFAWLHSCEDLFGCFWPFPPHFPQHWLDQDPRPASLDLKEEGVWLGNQVESSRLNEESVSQLRFEDYLIQEYVLAGLAEAKTELNFLEVPLSLPFIPAWQFWPICL